MLLRLRNVKISIYNPERKKWETKDDVTALITEQFIYIVNAEKFYHAVEKRFQESEFSSLYKDREKLNKKFNEFFNELLSKCPINEELHGIIYSGNTLWRVEREENSFLNMDVYNG